MADIRLLVLAVPIAAVALAAWIYFRQRVTPEEYERRRRETINARGRMVDAQIIDVNDSVYQYTYQVGGVTYTASQDLKGLIGAPDESELRLGPATVKYLPREPANSIVMADAWTGLRRPAQATLVDHTQKESKA